MMRFVSGRVLFAAVFALMAVSAVADPWQTSQLLNEPQETAVKSSRIYASKTGGFHAIYASTKPVWQVVYRRYNSGYLTPKSVAREIFCPNPAICEAGNGDIHVVWEDWSPDNVAGWAKSTNGGASWTVGTLTPWTGAKYPQIVPFGSSTGPDVVFTVARALQGYDKLFYFDRYNGSSWTGFGSMNSYFESEYQMEGSCRSLADGTVYKSYGRKIGGVYHVCFRRYNGSYWESEVSFPSTGGFFSRQSIAVNTAGQVMVAYEGNNVLITRVYTPGSGGGSWSTEWQTENLGTHGKVCAIPGSNDFYMVYVHDMKRVFGQRWSGGYWMPKELVSAGVPDEFTATSDVTAGPDGTIYACWEYWGSGDCQQWFNVKPGISGPKGTISGVVRDQYAQPVGGVTVGISGYATVSTVGTGEYDLDVPVGMHTVSANKDHYGGSSVQGVQVYETQTTPLDLTVTATPPDPVSEFYVDPSDGRNRIYWTNPTSGNFHGTRIVWRTDRFATGPTDGNILTDEQNIPGSTDTYDPDHAGLANGATYYYSAFSHDADGHYSAAVNRTAIPHSLRCSEAKNTGEGHEIDLTNKTITAIFPGDACIYVEEPDRTSGIRVGWSGTGLAVGDRVNINGTTAARVISGQVAERMVNATAVNKVSPAVNDPIKPLAMNGPALGGAALSPLVPGVKDGIGLNNMGMLVRISGKVTLVIASTIYVDDGSNIPDVPGRTGVMVKLPGVPSVAVGDIVSVTGIVEGSIPAGWAANRRYVHTRDWNDFQLAATAPANGGITGAVTTPSGSGVVGAVVSTTAGGYSTVSGAGGAYTISEVAPGSYSVTASASGYTTATQNNVGVTAGENTVCDFTLSPTTGAISGTVKDNNNAGIVGATVTAGSYSTTTTTGGAYTLSNVAPGAYTVTASKTYYNSANQDGVTVNAGSTTTCNLVLSPSVGSITGTVKDPSNAGIVGATVSTNTGGYTTTTGAGGAYTLLNVTPGSYNVTATKSGYTSQTNNGVAVTAGQATASSFTLTPVSGSITGTVRDSLNVAIVGATVATNTGGYTTTSGAGGSYTLSSVAPGTYNVTASKSGYNPQTANGVVVTAGGTTTTNFNLPVQAVEKLLNGGFEGGFFNSGWYGGYCANGWGFAWKGSPAENSFYCNSFNAGSPHNTVHLVQGKVNNFEVGIAQEISGLTVGAGYTFSAQSYKTGGSYETYIAVRQGVGYNSQMGTTTGTTFPSTTGSWVSQQVTGTVGSTGSVTVYLWVKRLSGSTADIHFDNASFMSW